MSMTPENDTMTWRDLTDQLTERQIAELEDQERDPDSLVRITGNPAYRYDGESLLDAARSYARNHLGAAMIGDVPAPAGAVRVYDWNDADNPDAYRLVDFSTRTITTPYNEITVEHQGVQYPDGRLKNEILLTRFEPLTTDEARRLAAALIAAADEIDGTTSG